MTEEIRSAHLPEDSVIRLLEQQARHGMDQESMLIYMCSLNLMSILNLLNKRQGGTSGLNLPVPAAVPALPPLANPGQAAGGGPSLESMISLLGNMLGSQAGGGAPGGGQGLNPALLMSLLSALGGQNLDLAGLMSKLAGMMGTGAKPAAGPDLGKPPAAAPGQNQPGITPNKVESQGEKAAAEERAARREVPKIMKWDLEDRKKA